MTTIVLPCCGTKTMPPHRRLRADLLNSAPQADVARQWLDRLHEVDGNEEKRPAVCLARNLYDGRGFRFGREAADKLGAEVLVVSAGLGLVRGDYWIPGYELTVSGTPVAGRIFGRFDAQAWWSQVSTGPYASDPVAALEGTKGPILMALSAPYAAMIRGTLERLSQPTLDRLTIYGRGLKPVLRVARIVRRLDTTSPEAVAAFKKGIMTDYPQRALLRAAAELAGAPA